MKNILLYVGIFILNVNYILYNTLNFDSGKNIVRVIAFILFLLHIAINNKYIYLKKEDFLFSLLLFVAFITAPFNEVILTFGFMLVIVIGAREIELKKLALILFYITLLSLGIVALMNIGGLITNITYSIGERTRQTFGFHNVNAFSQLLLAAMILFIISKKEIKVIHMLLINVVSFMFYIYTDTRSVFIMILTFTMLFILYSILRKMEDIYSVSKSLIALLNCIPVIISLASPLLLRKLPQLDFILSYRLSIFTHYVGQNKLINLFFGGTSIEQVDNGILVTIFTMGIFFMIFIMWRIYITSKISYRYRMIEYTSFSTSYLFFNMVESSIIRPENIISLFFWIYLMNLNKNFEENNKWELPGLY